MNKGKARRKGIQAQKKLETFKPKPKMLKVSMSSVPKMKCISHYDYAMKYVGGYDNYFSWNPPPQVKKVIKEIVPIRCQVEIFED